MYNEVRRKVLIKEVYACVSIFCFFLRVFLPKLKYDKQGQRIYFWDKESQNFRDSGFHFPS